MNTDTDIQKKAVGIEHLLDRVSMFGRLGYAADRHRFPYRYVQSNDGLGPHLLFAENVAFMLGCNIDFVRRISRSDLPAAKIGQRLIYRRTDVERFVNARIDNGAMKFVGTRIMGAKVCVPEEVPLGSGFDPTAYVQRALKKTPLA